MITVTVPTIEEIIQEASNYVMHGKPIKLSEQDAKNIQQSMQDNFGDYLSQCINDYIIEDFEVDL